MTGSAMTSLTTTKTAPGREPWSRIRAPAAEHSEKVALAHDARQAPALVEHRQVAAAYGAHQIIGYLQAVVAAEGSRPAAHHVSDTQDPEPGSGVATRVGSAGIRRSRSSTTSSRARSCTSRHRSAGRRSLRRSRRFARRGRTSSSTTCATTAWRPFRTASSPRGSTGPPPTAASTSPRPATAGT